MSSSEENIENGSAEDSPSPELTETATTAADLEPSAAEPDSGPAAAAAAEEERWPGWPGYCVFRMVVAVLKVGSIIGRKGELIKKMCEETKARIRVLDGPLGNPDRIVLITGHEEPELPLSPAMDATIRVFKRINGLSENETDGAVAGVPFCSVRLLIASSQAMTLIGKQGSLIKSMQESSGASIRILNNDELPVYASQDERIAELQGESAKVLKALEVVLGHLRKFLVDQTVLPLFEKSYNTPAPVIQERQVDTWAEKLLLHSASQPMITSDYPHSSINESLFIDRESSQLEQRLSAPRVSIYSQDSGLSGLRSSGLARASGPIVTQVAQTMQIPLSYAEDIIGIGGANIAYIRRSSGAILTVQESRGLPDEITVEIKGTSLQVQTAQQLIQDFVNNHKEPVSSSYLDAELRAPSSFSHLGGSAYSSSSMPTQPYGGGGYGSSGLGGGGYGSYRY